MSKIFQNIQPAVKKETKNVAVYTFTGVVLMWIVYFILHRVILGGIGGGLIAVLNFFLLGLTVQKVASTEDEETARKFMKSSYSQRMLLQAVWVIAAIAAPCFQ